MTKGFQFRVVRKDNGDRNPHTGVVSLHHSREDAQAHIDRANRTLRNQPGNDRAWHPYAIQQAEDGELFVDGE